MTSIYRCECGQTFSKLGNGSMGAFKSDLDKHPAYRAFFKIVLDINTNSNSKELEK